MDINKIKLNSKINDCINIENIIINFNKINEKITNNNLKKIKISFIPEDNNKLNELFEKIRTFGEIKEDTMFFKFKPGKNYIVSENGLIATTQMEEIIGIAQLLGIWKYQKIKLANGR